MFWKIKFVGGLPCLLNIKTGGWVLLQTTFLAILFSPHFIEKMLLPNAGSHPSEVYNLGADHMVSASQG